MHASLIFDSIAAAGEGSFAKVYVGQHLFTGENVVVKAVDKKKVLESNVYTEIEVLRKVTHPYIMRLYAAYEQGRMAVWLRLLSFDVFFCLLGIFLSAVCATIHFLHLTLFFYESVSPRVTVPP